MIVRLNLSELWHLDISDMTLSEILAYQKVGNKILEERQKKTEEKTADMNNNFSFTFNGPPKTGHF